MCRDDPCGCPQEEIRDWRCVGTTLAVVLKKRLGTGDRNEDFALAKSTLTVIY